MVTTDTFERNTSLKQFDFPTKGTEFTNYHTSAMNTIQNKDTKEPSQMSRPQSASKTSNKGQGRRDRSARAGDRSR